MNQNELKNVPISIRPAMSSIPSGAIMHQDPEGKGILIHDPTNTLNAQHPSDPFEVSLTPEENPQNFSSLRKWTAVIVVSVAACCVTLSSSVVISLSVFESPITDSRLNSLGSLHGDQHRV